MKQWLGRFFSNPFIQGGAILTISTVFSNFLNYFFHLLVGRTLGPDAYGEVAALFSYIVLAGVPLTIVSTTLIQKIASRDSDRLLYSQSIERWINGKVSRWWWLAIVALAFIPFIPRLTNLSLFSSAILVLSFIIVLLTAFYTAALNGLRLFAAFASISLIATLFKFAGAGLAAIGLGNLSLVLLFFLLSMLFSLIASYSYFHKHVGSTINQQPVTSNPQHFINKRIIHVFHDKQLWLTAASLMAVNILSNADIIAVKKFLSANEAGLYSAWSLFAKAIIYALAPVMSVLFVFFSSGKEKGRRSAVIWSGIGFFALAGIVFFLAYRLIPNIAIGLLFGNKFNRLIPYLPLAAIFGGLYGIVNLFTQYNVAQKKSAGSLALPLLIPFYVLSLAVWGRSLGVIMEINLVFASIITVVFLFLFVKGD